MRVAINIVAKNYPKAVELFCMIGMMPGGVFESNEIQDFKGIWKNDNYHGLIWELENAGLIKKKKFYPNIELFENTTNQNQ